MTPPFQSPTRTSGEPCSRSDVTPQGLVDSIEGGPVCDVATPTTHHQLEEGGGAEWRAVEEDLRGWG